jgi:hypothetical protein
MPSRSRMMPALLAAAVCAAGCPSEPKPSAENSPDVVYVDTQSGAVVRGEPSAALPAVNPRTGRRTLMPGLYCAECRKWYPAPPLEVRHRAPAAGKCPRHGTALTPDGPLPGE